MARKETVTKLVFISRRIQAKLVLHIRIGESVSSKYVEFFMHKCEEATHNYFASLGYRLGLPIAYLGISLGSVMLECNVIVLVRLKGVWEQSPHQ